MMFLTLLVGFLVLQSPGVDNDSCVSCHSELAGTPLGEPVELFQDDIHRELGFSCASCHGGDPTAADMEAAKDPSKGYVGAPGLAEIPALCGSCHSSPDFMKQYNPQTRVDQVAEYRTSVHGRRAAEGDLQVATCISCHSVHDIRRVNDVNSPTHPTQVAETCGSCHSDAERMEPYGIPTDQVVEYRQSVHSGALYDKRDLSAPTCNDCHGNHGATPPGVASVANVCGNCHRTQQNLFESSPHSEMFMLMELKSCTTCHGNHSIIKADERLLSGSDSVCATCHESDSGMEAAQQMAGEIRRLIEQIDSAHKILEEAEQAGMEVSQPIYDLRSSQENIILARHEVHSLDLEALRAAVEEGLKVAEGAYQEGVAALEELDFRRRGLYISLIIIVLAIASLLAWIRFIET